MVPEGSSTSFPGSLSYRWVGENPGNEVEGSSVPYSDGKPREVVMGGGGDIWNHALTKNL